MKILNLGCGTKVSAHPSVVNIDWSIYLKIKKNPLLHHVVKHALSPERRSRLEALPKAIMVWDLRKGIPFPDQSVHGVYHSHFLEHIDRGTVAYFLEEVKRVLKPGGVHRIVVPDMEVLCKKYLYHLQVCDAKQEIPLTHDKYMADMISHFVQQEASGTKAQGLFNRLLENWILGSAHKRGQTHRWMYDRINLQSLLLQTGYTDIKLVDYRTSRIPNWPQIGLDCDMNGLPYKPDSLYVEATCG